MSLGLRNSILVLLWSGDRNLHQQDVTEAIQFRGVGLVLGLGR